MQHNAETVVTRLNQARLSRLDRLIVISGVAWACFALVYLSSEHVWPSSICAVTALLTACLYPLVAHYPKSRWGLANIHMAVSMVGLCSISLITGQADSYSTLFLCCFGLFAAHMLGLRASMFWTAMCVGCIVFINSEVLVGKLPVLCHHSIFDKTLHCVGLALLIFGLDWQSQHYFMVQTRDLIETTSSLKSKADALEQFAQFDTLTGLFNRRSFHRQAQISLMQAKEDKCGMAILLLDLDGFKEVNDTLGHQVGDIVLQEVAKRLKGQVEFEHLVARLGGDEFTVIIENIECPELILEISERLADCLSLPCQIEGKDFTLGVSIGASQYPAHADSTERLLSFADTAMYHAKSTNQTAVIYDPGMTQELVKRKQLEKQLSTALASEEFRLVYQPQLNVQSGRIVGFEALLRWRKDGKWISPIDFIGSLESTREIYNVGGWVLQEACIQAQRWRDLGFDINISANVSANQFRDPKIMERVLTALETSRLDPTCLDIEVTESVLIHDVDSTAETLFELRDLGVSISIDDFGTGYSSMAYLRKLPITRLKIDRTFIKDIPNEDDGIIAQSIVSLSRNLKLQVLAEGVEEQEQLDFLKGLGCDEYQGYYFSKPIPAEECNKLLQKQNSNKTLKSERQHL